MIGPSGWLDPASGSDAISLRGSSRNGLATHSRPNLWPCCKSSVSNNSAPASMALSTISASQYDICDALLRCTAVCTSSGKTGVTRRAHRSATALRAVSGASGRASFRVTET